MHCRAKTSTALPKTACILLRNNHMFRKDQSMLSRLHQSFCLCGLSENKWSCLKTWLSCCVIRSYPWDRIWGTEWFPLCKDVRQRCILPPYPFNLYTEYFVWKAGRDSDGRGKKTVGKHQFKICKWHHITGRKHRWLETTPMKVKDTTKVGLELNIKTTITIEGLHNFNFDNREIEIVKDFVC